MKIKIMSDAAYAHLKKNIEIITDKIKNNENNEWIYEEFEQPMFIEKEFDIEDFELESNPKSKDKDIDFKNSIKLYDNLKKLPKYILSDNKFWLWLHFEKFYSVTRTMMDIKNSGTVEDHWLFGGGNRRGIFFGVLSRCYYRAESTIDTSLEDKYELTKWIIDNPERFRNLTWRSFSSQYHLVRGIIKGEKKAVEKSNKEKVSVYKEISKYVSIIGSTKILDAINEEDIEEMIYNKMVELL